MDIRQLRYFTAVVDNGSFTRAAEKLNIAQPALSQQVRKLEDDLGAELLLRTARGVVPTEQGALLLTHARRILHDLETLRDEVRGAEAEPEGPVTVGIPTSLGLILSVPLALTVRARLPKVRLRIVEGLSGHTLEWLRAGQVDVALVFGVETVPGLSSRKVATEILHVIGPPDDPKLRNARGVPFFKVAALPLILPGRPHGLREEAERTAQEMSVPLNVILEMDALDHIKAMVTQGAGYTILSHRVALRELRDRSLSSAPIVSPEIERTIHLSHSADRPLGIAARHVRDLLSDLLDGLVRDGRWRDI
jgi:LysR family nitrogen assimilation transcriptional regulator